MLFIKNMKLYLNRFLEGILLILAISFLIQFGIQFIDFENLYNYELVKLFFLSLIISIVFSTIITAFYYYQKLKGLAK
jgi:hypothetical protein